MNASRISLQVCALSITLVCLCDEFIIPYSEMLFSDGGAVARQFIIKA
jgi:hypothetical protein